MNDPIDKALEIGSAFDWISPLLAGLGDLFNGPSHTFQISYQSCPMSGREINVMLNRRHIKNWGHMIVGDTFLVSVRQADARQAQQALQSRGVPIQNPYTAKASPTAKGRPGSQHPAQVASRWYQCQHCGRWYRQWKSSCPSCGAPLQPG